MLELAELLRSAAMPLLRLLAGLCLGLLLANIVEALGLTRVLGRFAAPLVRAAHLGCISGAAFSLAFVSPSTANALLSEHYEAGRLSRKELVLSNLFNSLPSYLVHLPTLVLLMWPVLGTSVLIYAGLTICAAGLRTGVTVLVGHIWLQSAAQPDSTSDMFTIQQRGEPHKICWQRAWSVAWKRFRRRVPRLLLFTIPIYLLMLTAQQMGYFDRVEEWLAGQAIWGAWLKPQTLSIVMLSLLAEVGASISAAGAALDAGGISTPEIILALLIGNIVSSPMRAFRHQFPAYAGYYRPGMALRLIVINQGLRTISLIMVAALYVLC